MARVFVLRHAGMPFDWLERLGSDDLAAAADCPRAEFDQVYAQTRARLRAELRLIVENPRFRSAVLLSNPTVYEGMLRGFLARDEVPDNARFRRVERQMYRYLQRFCAKNETTSDFGPMGYGEVDDGAGLRVRRVPVRRTVQLGRWALEELARAVARDRELAADIPLRRSLAVPADASETLVWTALADGPATLVELASRSGCSVRETAAELRPLLADGSVHRGLVWAAETVDGLAGLRAAVAALPGRPARDRWLAELDRFDADRTGFAAAGPDRRLELLGEMEARFTDLTGVPARRGAGAVYADRLILFEETGSPFRVQVGADLAAEVERASSDGLDVCAVYGAAAQRDCRGDVVSIVDAPMTLADYLSRARPAGELRSRFAAPVVESLAVPSLDEVVPAQRYALPDICLLGADPAEASARPRVVLARVHHHLALNGWLTTFADDPARFDAEVVAWLTGSEEGRATACLATSRRNKGFYQFPGPRVLVTAVDHEGREPSVAARELVVTADGDRPKVTGPDGREVLLYPMLADLSTYPPVAALTPTPVLHPRVNTTDRVELGGAVFQRASAHLDLTPFRAVSGADAFLALRAMAVGAGLPRFVFVRVGSERKPLLVDTCSPFGADLLCHLANSDGTGFAEEMLPGPDDLWLSDENGRYTCEFRVQFTRATAGPGSPE